LNVVGQFSWFLIEDNQGVVQRLSKLDILEKLLRDAEALHGGCFYGVRPTQNAFGNGVRPRSVRPATSLAGNFNEEKMPFRSQARQSL
jgi:hypothetical protein